MNRKTGKKNRRITVSIVILLFALAAARLYYDNQIFGVLRYTVSSDQIPQSFDGFKIVQLSDLHSKDFGNRNQKLVTKISRQNPDIVVMTGDMVNSYDKDFSVFLELAKEICKNYDTYYIAGNHEENLDDELQRNLEKELEDMGVRVLDNESVVLTRGMITSGCMAFGSISAIIKITAILIRKTFSPAWIRSRRFWEKRIKKTIVSF